MSKRSVGISTVFTPRATWVELVDAGAVRQRRHDQRGIGRGGAGHQVAEVVGDDEGHLAVGQHRGLRPAGRARGEEEPAGVVALDRRVGSGAGPACSATRASQSASPKPASPIATTAECRRRSQRGGVVGEVGVADHAGGAAGLRQIGDLVRGLAEVRRHPDGAERGSRRTSTRTSGCSSATARGCGRPCRTPKRDAAPRPSRRRGRRARPRSRLRSPQTSAIASG